MIYPVVLFVDDSIRSLELMEKIMQKSKIKSVFTSCAKETVGIIESYESIKIIFLNILMPGMDGHILAEKIKNSFPNRKLKLYYVSALRDEKHVKKA